MRKAVQGYIQVVDVMTLRMIHAMLQEYAKPSDDDELFYQELEGRRKEYELGKSKSYTVEEAMVELRKRRTKKN